MPRTSALVLVPLVLGIGCRPEGPRDAAPPRAATPRPAILATVPRLDRSLIQDTTGSEDAEQLQMLVQLPFDSVLGFYRTRLPAEGWRITSDLADSATATLMADKGGPLLWVQVRRLGGFATQYTLIAGSEPAERPGPVMATPPHR